jgi:AraC-like DNA-binding protein
MDMISDPSSALLHRYPIFQTTDAEEFRHAILTEYGGTGVELDSRSAFKARGNRARLQNISILHAANTSGGTTAYAESEDIKFLTALKGRGAASIAGETSVVDESRSCIISPKRCVEIESEGDYGRLSVHIKASALEQKLTSILGYRPKGRLEFEASVDNDLPEVRFLRQHILLLAQQLDSRVASFPAYVLQSFEQAIIVALLCATRHTFSDLLRRDPRGAAPRQVRQAEDYIEANWNQAIKIEALATLVGVSVRSLFKSFKESRGYSPMSFAKMVRLKHAKEMLSKATPQTSVTGVALRCGFGNLGHFAKDYRETFGELPVESLMRARRMTGEAMAVRPGPA